jgi:hypothetical protein
MAIVALTRSWFGGTSQLCTGLATESSATGRTPGTLVRRLSSVGIESWRLFGGVARSRPGSCAWRRTLVLCVDAEQPGLGGPVIEHALRSAPLLGRNSQPQLLAALSSPLFGEVCLPPRVVVLAIQDDRGRQRITHAPIKKSPRSRTVYSAPPYVCCRPCSRIWSTTLRNISWLPQSRWVYSCGL